MSVGVQLDWSLAVDKGVGCSRTHHILKAGAQNARSTDHRRCIFSLCLAFQPVVGGQVRCNGRALSDFACHGESQSWEESVVGRASHGKSHSWGEPGDLEPISRNYANFPRRGGKERCILDFSGETWGKETAWKTQA